jgi:hypothetical protein
MTSIASAPPLMEQIVAFLRSIGIDVVEESVPNDSFLPGLHISSGRMLFDRVRLLWPGDLLHEAGHIAVTPAAERSALSGDVAGREELSHDGEVETIAWSYAAARAMGLDPSVVFHSAGYQGHAEALLRTYSLGVYPGVAGLEAWGMTLGAAAAKERGVPAYPNMLCWLRT